ncbi:MAG: helix-turn-helix domain-containing protein, partial [Nitrospira sp.]|nr:helix-turn-helix domain-containing protein [Nitrospira sp.]
MEQTWLTVDELAAVLKVSPKSIRRAYRKGEIPVDRFCRFVRFDLERVKEALKAKGRGQTFVV